MKQHFKKPTTIHLPVYKKWFDLTKSGVKKEDYRDITPYWINRLFDWKNEPNWGINDFVREFYYHGNELGFVEKYAKKFDYNIMTLGYPKKDDLKRILKIEHRGIEIRTGKPEWGAEPDRNYIVIVHGDIKNQKYE